jgi:phosphomannomutase
VLSGNELGLLLADFVLAQAPTVPTPLLITSVVSSPIFRELARSRGARHEQTLTGFKWIWRAARTLETQGGVRFGFGCEEAIGYSAFGLVRDKDGISAAVWLAELAERCLRQGRSLLDQLYSLSSELGYWGSAQRSLVRTGLEGAVVLRAMVERLAAAPPTRLAGLDLVEQRDFRRGAEERAQWLGATPLLEFCFEGGSRVLVRPSGTEPKLKIYADYREPNLVTAVPSALLDRARAGALGLADAMIEQLSAYSES